MPCYVERLAFGTLLAGKTDTCCAYIESEERPPQKIERLAHLGEHGRPAIGSRVQKREDAELMEGTTFKDEQQTTVLTPLSQC